MEGENSHLLSASSKPHSAWKLDISFIALKANDAAIVVQVNFINVSTSEPCRQLHAKLSGNCCKLHVTSFVYLCITHTA